MSEYYLASGSNSSTWPYNALILSDEDLGYDVTGSIQENSSSVAMLAANVDAIYLQRMPSGALSQGGFSADLVYLQRMPSGALSQGGFSADLVYLQRQGRICPDKMSTLVWLMRARNTANTRYIYWRSPHNPGTKQIDTNTIILNTVETVGSVYEEI